MLLHIPEVLSAEQVAYCRRALETADWADGRVTAGYQSAKAKHNLQLPETQPLATELGAIVLQALAGKIAGIDFSADQLNLKTAVGGHA